MKKLKPGQAVCIDLKTKKIHSIVISEDPKKENYYFLNWSGYPEIFKTISVRAAVIKTVESQE